MGTATHPNERIAAVDMPFHPGWSDIAVRLALTMFAGAIIGFNRGARGHAAGFRTTILVGLAASVAMIQANILLPLEGKTPGSFAVMDLMRLPLGILTGVGFIGGGTILKKGDLVTGVTTAATLWLMTVIGLCLGGGARRCHHGFGRVDALAAKMGGPGYPPSTSRYVDDCL
jgi:putative Mg2+ transporter-C (MgtC) family protein